MTTERKIEIATAVLNDPRLGVNQPICWVLPFHTNAVERKLIKKLLYEYYKELGGDALFSEYWFTVFMPEARTERIEFLQKYIEHLKAQS
jgi:hypothetical protein